MIGTTFFVLTNEAQEKKSVKFDLTPNHYDLYEDYSPTFCYIMATHYCQTKTVSGSKFPFRLLRQVVNT